MFRERPAGYCLVNAAEPLLIRERPLGYCLELD